MNLPGKLLLALPVLSLALASAASGADLVPGSYSAKAPGISATVTVERDGDATLRYSMKSECGKTQGKMDLKNAGANLKGKRVSRGPNSSLRTTSAKLNVSGDGLQIAGTLKDGLSGGSAKAANCSAKKKFSAKRPADQVFVPARDGGHYEGVGDDGYAISFDVARDPASDGYLLTNLSVDIVADCSAESDIFGNEFQLVTHLRPAPGFEGKISSTGDVEFDYEPDEFTLYSIYGSLAGGAAELEAEVSGYFDREGYPDVEGDMDCDSFGATYSATQQ